MDAWTSDVTSPVCASAALLRATSCTGARRYLCLAACWSLFKMQRVLARAELASSALNIQGCTKVEGKVPNEPEGATPLFFICCWWEFVFNLGRTHACCVSLKESPERDGLASVLLLEAIPSTLSRSAGDVEACFLHHQATAGPPPSILLGPSSPVPLLLPCSSVPPPASDSSSIITTGAAEWCAIFHSPLYT